jgi:regulator of nucleoside diphosphate kinase
MENVMNVAVRPAASAPPPVRLCESDYDTIAELALAIERRSPELAAQLLGEIDRAEICPAGTLPPDVVRLGSEVEFADVETGAARTVRLVLPAEADIDSGRVSILTSVGAGLIGLSVGQSIDWPSPAGRARTLRILAVRPPAA